MKAQSIRLLDVVFIGPLLLYVARAAKAPGTLVRVLLVVVGVATIVYNWRNYLRLRAIESQRDLRPRRYG